MAMSTPIKDIPRPNLAKGTYRGIVVDNNDPDKRQRVKIRIPQLHRGIPDDKLPWTMPSSSGQSHAGAGVGSVFVPPIGALLEGTFEEDDPHNFRTHGSPPVDNVNKDNEILGEDYPYTEGHVDPAGNKFTVNKLRNEILMQHKSGASIFFDGAGNISINAKGRVHIGGPQGVNVVSEDQVKIHTKKDMEIKAKPVKLNGSGPTSSARPPASRATPTIPSPRGKTEM